MIAKDYVVVKYGSKDVTEIGGNVDQKGKKNLSDVTTFHLSFIVCAQRFVKALELFVFQLLLRQMLNHLFVFVCIGRSRLYTASGTVQRRGSNPL